MTDLQRRRSLLVAALGALLVKDERGEFPELRAVHQWLDNWRGIGHVVTGMTRQGFVVNLSQYGADRWIASFETRGGGYSLTGTAGVAQDGTPWRAVQRAAWKALDRRTTT